MNTDEEENEETLPTIPTSVQYLITEYGNYVGLEGFAFDEENQILLEVGGKEVLIEFVSEQNGLIFQTLVTTLASAPSKAMLTTLLALNAASLRNAHGIVALHAENNSLIWMDRLNLEGLTVEALDRAIDATEIKTQVWSEIITKILEDEKLLSPESDQLAETIIHNAIPV